MPAPNVAVPALDRVPRKLRRTLATGLLAQTNGDYVEALRCYQVAARRDPNDFLSLYFAALCAFSLKDKERAIRLMYASLKRNPAHPEAWYNLGKFYQDRANIQKAVECYVAAIEQRPDFGPALVNAGNAYWELGDEEMAEVCYRHALVAKNGGPEAVYNLSFMLHLKGEWPAAFEAAEARWECAGYYVEYRKPFMEELIRYHVGMQLTGSLLLHGEQGHGDIIQHLRYVPQLVERVGGKDKLIIGVLDGLVRLCEISFPGIRVVGTAGDITGVVAHLPSVSLPREMKTSWENPPPNSPYLSTGSERQSHVGPFRIGLCWAGSPTHPRDYTRSMPFKELVPLLHEHPDAIEWVNLQVGERAKEWLTTLPYHAAPVAEVGPDWDYLDTARLMETCDLIITVDTSVAHLAGALGIDCWMLVARFPDVRWMLNKSDTIWYPSVLIFRQTKAGEWGEVVRIVRQLLDLKLEFREAGL